MQKLKAEMSPLDGKCDGNPLWDAAQMANKKAGRTRLFNGEAIYCGFLGATGVAGLLVVAFGGAVGFLRSEGVVPRIVVMNRS